MEKNISKKRRKIIIWSASILTFFLLMFGACAVYVSDYYHADLAAIEAFQPSGDDAEADTQIAAPGTSGISIEQTSLTDGTLVFSPEEPAAGFIFYPGGKVEYTAYIPLMEACAAEGILCALVEMPFNLAVLDINAADGIRQHFPAIDSWYIGGHSLGGSMAASYLAEHTDEFDGLILLGSYSTADLSGTDLNVLSVYGSEDLVMNREKYADNKANLPDNFTEIIIEGGCHAYFGMYGAQDGDGTPSISNEEQIELTAEAITALF